jgi:hypothetical protein
MDVEYLHELLKLNTLHSEEVQFIHQLLEVYQTESLVWSLIFAPLQLTSQQITELKHIFCDPFISNDGLLEALQNITSKHD